MANKGQSGYSLDKNAIDEFSQVFAMKAPRIAELVDQAKAYEAYFSEEQGNIEGEEADDVRRTMRSAGVYMENISKVVAAVQKAADQTREKVDESISRANSRHQLAEESAAKANQSLKDLKK